MILNLSCVEKVTNGTLLKNNEGKKGDAHDAATATLLSRS